MTVTVGEILFYRGTLRGTLHTHPSLSEGDPVPVFHREGLLVEGQDENLAVRPLTCKRQRVRESGRGLISARLGFLVREMELREAHGADEMKRADLGLRALCVIKAQ